VVDFFAGSGTTGEAAAANGRTFLLIDSNPDAVEVMAKRLARFDPELVGFESQAQDEQVGLFSTEGR
jgi:site-specific DNA-methyltransferase (adenine-specific)